MFNGIEVWRLWGPLHDFDFVLFEALFGFLTGVLRVIVLLENDIINIVVPVEEGILQLILHNLHIEVSIHLALGPA